jgi:fructokinase
VTARRDIEVPVLVVGESILDVVVDGDGNRTPVPGGSPMNVAVGLGRLENEVRLITSLGSDDAGDLIRKHLSASGVALHPNSATTARTSTATATIGGDGAADYDFTIDWALPETHLTASASIVHTGSIAAICEPGATGVRRLLTDLRPAALVTFDPNIRPALAGDHHKRVSDTEDFFALADVVKLSEEDAGWLYPSLNSDDVIDHILSFGPTMVGLTLGAHGAVLATKGHRTIQQAMAPHIVDTVGAGDAFMAGLIHGLADLLATTDAPPTHMRSARLVDADSLSRIAHLASLCSAVTVQRAGADLPRWLDLAASASP